MDDTGRLPLRCLSLDLEVGRRDGRIRAFAAVRTETGGALTFHDGALGPALASPTGSDSIWSGTSWC